MRIFPEQPNISKAPAHCQYWYRPTLWELNDEYKITLLCGKQIIIHFGFRFSASVPWPFWIFLKPTGTIFLAGLVHDNLFKYNPFRWTRKRCDHVFWEIAERVKRRKYVHWAAYMAVRLGGLKAWKGYRDKEKT